MSNGFYDDLAIYGTAVRDAEGRHVPLSDVVLYTGAQMMTKDQIIMRREEALRMRWSVIIIDEVGEVTPEMWDRWATIDRHNLLSEARRAEKNL